MCGIIFFFLFSLFGAGSKDAIITNIFLQSISGHSGMSLWNQMIDTGVLIKPIWFELKLAHRVLYKDNKHNMLMEKIADSFICKKIWKKSIPCLIRRSDKRKKESTTGRICCVYLRWTVNQTGSIRQFSTVAFFYSMKWMVRFPDMNNGHN